MRRSISILSPVICVVVLSPSASAWNKPGHMVVASLAFRELKQKDPTKLGEYVALLKKHVHFQQFWLPVLNTIEPSQRDQALFLLAARWPDDMREPGFEDFHRRVW